MSSSQVFTNSITTNSFHVVLLGTGATVVDFATFGFKKLAESFKLEVVMPLYFSSFPYSSSWTSLAINKLMLKRNNKLICHILLAIYLVKFIYSEKATKFCEISAIDLSYVVPVKSTVEILKNFVAFSEYMNFKFDPFWSNLIQKSVLI